jgi:hypothetical protein
MALYLKFFLTMKDLIQRTISILKIHVKNNLEVINQNQTIIKQILQEPASSKRTINFEKHYEVNRNLLSENNDLINVQLTLINFLEKYKDSDLLREQEPDINSDPVTDEEEIFRLTVSGMIPFDSKHPKYDDTGFFEKLLCHYKDNEEYEKCQQLMKTRHHKMR